MKNDRFMFIVAVFAWLIVNLFGSKYEPSEAIADPTPAVEPVVEKPEPAPPVPQPEPEPEPTADPAPPLVQQQEYRRVRQRVGLFRWRWVNVPVQSYGGGS